MSRARGQRRRRQFRLLGHSVVSLGGSPIPRAKPGLPRPVKFCARLPLPDGRVNSGSVLSAYSSPGFAVAIYRHSARAEKPSPAQGCRIATVTQRTGLDGRAGNTVSLRQAFAWSTLLPCAGASVQQTCVPQETGQSQGGFSCFVPLPFRLPSCSDQPL